MAKAHPLVVPADITKKDTHGFQFSKHPASRGEDSRCHFRHSSLRLLQVYNVLSHRSTLLHHRYVSAIRFPPLTLLTPSIIPAWCPSSSKTTTGVSSLNSSGTVSGGFARFSLFMKRALKNVVSMSIYDLVSA